MSGLIIVCARQAASLPFSADDLRRCAARLAPDNITPHAPLLSEEPGLLLAVVNPMPDLPRREGAVCVGALIGHSDGWVLPGASRPNGTYAGVRWNVDRLELLSDNVASRTLWYVLREDVFLASTSQRALVLLLGDLRLNEAAVAWLASSGTLGPGNGWDTRLQQVPAAAVLSLDRHDWILHLTAESTDHHPEPLPDQVHLTRWRDALLETCADLDVSLDSWLLPLSGGLDSRVILAGLVAAGRRPRCVTWGLRRSLDDPGSDSAVARRIARYYGVQHTFLAVDGEPTRPGEVIDRYLVAGEGRTDQISGYLDGLAIWRRFFEDGVTGTIRGDEPGWGYEPVHSAVFARRSNRAELLTDFPETHLIRQLGLAPQQVPDWLHQRPDESLVLYDNRLTDAFQTPLDLGPLNDVKCAYMEVANPFFSDRLMQVTRELSEDLRRDRRGFAAVVAELGPPIPEAKRSALAGLTSSLRSEAFLAEMVAELSSSEAERICERTSLDLVVRQLQRPGATSAHYRLRRVARTLIPRRLRTTLRPDPPATLSPERLALRLVLASRMVTLLSADAIALRGRGGRSQPTSDTSQT